MMTDYTHSPRKGLYRSRNGMFLGVCQGLADHLDMSVTGLRVGVFLLQFFFFPVALLAYIIIGLIMKPEPIIPFRDDMDREFYDSYNTSKTMAIQRLRQTYDNLDRRIRRIESIVTSRDFDWENRIRSGTRD